MSWLSGWSYAREISLTGQTGSGTLYQVDLDIGASAGGDFHLENLCTNFPQDIEVTDNDGTTLLNFSIEDITADPIKMWVEVTDDLGSNKSIWVYFGKSGATTNSDIGATFLFGDDFPGSSIDTGKWSGSTGNASVSGGILTFSASGTWIYIYGATQTAPYACRYRAKMGNSASNNYDSGVGMRLSDGTRHAQGYSNPYDVGVGNWNVYDGATSNQHTGTFPIPPDYTYYIGDILVTSSNIKFYTDGSLDITESAILPQNMPASVGVRTGNIYVDWIVIRKYVSPEPAFASAGARQNAPVVGAIMNQFQKANMGADLYNGAIIA